MSESVTRSPIELSAGQLKTKAMKTKVLDSMISNKIFWPVRLKIFQFYVTYL